MDVDFNFMDIDEDTPVVQEEKGPRDGKYMLKDLIRDQEPITETMSRIMPETRLDWQTFTHALPGVLTLSREEWAHEHFEKMRAQYDQAKREPSITIVISGMGSESGGISAHIIPLDHTFGDLAESLTDFNSDFLPDFWSKEVDPTHNCITESGVRWEWQDPSKKVIDVINKEGHIGIEMVCKDVEYVVVLVKKGMVENGMPIEIPRTCRQRALPYLQRHFPNHTVSQVRRLPLGDDVRDAIFDNRNLRHQTNPLFVELSSELSQPDSLLVTGQKMDKVKGRATDE